VSPPEKSDETFVKATSAPYAFELYPHRETAILPGWATSGYDFARNEL